MDPYSRIPELKITRDADHNYYADWGAGEVVLPSVTNIISPLRDLSSIPPAVLMDAANHGKYVHSLTEIIDGGRGGSGLDMGSVAPFYHRYIEPYEKLKKDYDLEPVLIEEMVASKMGYAGTLDRLYWCGKKASHYLADITTSTSNRSAKWVQMVGYKMALLESHVMPKQVPKIDLMLIIADRQGKFTVLTDESESSMNWIAFLSCLNIYKWRKRNGQR